MTVLSDRNDTDHQPSNIRGVVMTRRGLVRERNLVFCLVKTVGTVVTQLTVPTVLFHRKCLTPNGLR